MRRSYIYEELNVDSDLDLLTHFPKRYELLDLTPPAKQYADKERFVIKGRLLSFMTSVPNVKMLRFTIATDDGSRLKAFIFGQMYYKTITKPNIDYVFVGRYSERTKAFSVTQVIKADNPFVQTGIKPIYTLNKDIKQNDFYKLIKDVLYDPTLEIPEILPQPLRRKYNLESRKQAFRDVHLPQNIDSLNNGLKVFKYEEALKYALNSLCLKEYVKSLKKTATIKIDTTKINEYVKTLPYTLTHDQVQAIREIVIDMNQTYSMNRLLQGDVGTGKTAVAFASLYANYLRKGQGALMVPTLTLAKQHYTNALKAFAPYGIKVCLYDATLKANLKKEVSDKIARGEYDIVIGTHSLFSENLAFLNLTYAIIDEQHRFGVMQRTALSKKGEGCDLLMMSATPIPRTLSKIIFADLDVSELHQFPNGERKVKTLVVKPHDEKVQRAIDWALKNHRQIFVVVPKIDSDLAGKRKYSATSVYDEYVEKLGEEKVGLLHGRMKSEDKDDIYDRFKSGECPVLVSTTVIEVGVDVSEAALMIVYDANFFGLATLHQLRGRIGRDGQEAFALFLYDGDDEDAIARLQYLATNKDGGDIALYDLQNRGAGSYIGENQTGSSELNVANFVTDKAIFEQAVQDATYIYEHLDNPEYNVYYQMIRKELFKAELK